MSDDTTRKNVELIQSMDFLDEATRNAADALRKIPGAGGSGGAIGMKGLEDDYARQAGAVKRFLDAMESGGALDVIRAQNDLANSGVDMNRFGGDEKRAYEALRTESQIHEFRRAEAVREVDAALMRLPDHLREVPAIINSLWKAEMAHMGDFNAFTGASVGARPLSKAEIDQVRADYEASEKLPGKKAVKQTVNVYINQVSSKDPDRWIADIDDMAARRISNPRAAKSRLAGAL